MRGWQEGWSTGATSRRHGNPSDHHWLGLLARLAPKVISWWGHTLVLPIGTLGNTAASRATMYKPLLSPQHFIQKPLPRYELALSMYFWPFHSSSSSTQSRLHLQIGLWRPPASVPAVIWYPQIPILRLFGWKCQGTCPGINSHGGQKSLSIECSVCQLSIPDTVAILAKWVSRKLRSHPLRCLKMLGAVRRVSDRSK